MKINQIKIQDIKPYEKNAKKHSDKQIEQVANSIKRFGFVQPLVVDKNNEIIQRYVDYVNNPNIIKNGEKIIWQKTK